MAITSNVHSLILQRFAQVGQTTVERETGVDNTQLSKFCSGERGLRIDQIGPVLLALGLKVVDTGSKDVDPEYLHALEILAQRALNKPALSSGQ